MFSKYVYLEKTKKGHKGGSKESHTLSWSGGTGWKILDSAGQMIVKEVSRDDERQLPWEGEQSHLEQQDR